MSSNGIISEEYDHFLLAAQQEKALRLVLKPIVQHYFDPPHGRSVGEISSTMREYLKSRPVIDGNLNWHQGFEMVVEALLGRVPQPNEAAVAQFPRPARTDIALDPRYSEYAILRYFACQIVQHAVSTQDIICLAQNGDIFGRISPDRLKDSESETLLVLPAENDPCPVSKINAHWCEELAADQLWFAFLTDLEADPETEISVRTGNENEKMPKRLGTKSGYSSRDKPFVDRAIQLLESGQTGNANEAVTLLANSEWKNVSPDAASFEKAIAGHGTFESKKKRLYNQVRERLKR